MFPSELTAREWLALAGMDSGAAGVMAAGYLADVPFLVGLAGLALLATSFAALRARRD